MASVRGKKAATVDACGVITMITLDDAARVIKIIENASDQI